MIVRILGEGQYTVADDHRKTLEQLEDAVDQAVDRSDEAGFATALAALTAEVRQAGEPLADDAFAPSDLVVPFADSTLAETKALLADHGDTNGGQDR
jgi:hypothetical protein